MMARKVAGGVVLLLLVALLLCSSADAKATPIECSFHHAKNPSCGDVYKTDGACGKQCASEGYHRWICLSNCTCLVCPSLDLENRPETVELQKQGNRGALDAGVGAD